MTESKLKVLIAEDDLVIAQDIRNTLEENGYSVVSMAATGKDAVKMTESEKPDLILMDINLRGKMNGIDAAEIIQKSNNVPIIFVTGLTDDESFLHAYLTKPAAYLTKPFKRVDLLKKIDKTFKAIG